MHVAGARARLAVKEAGLRVLPAGVDARKGAVAADAGGVPADLLLEDPVVLGAAAHALDRLASVAESLADTNHCPAEGGHDGCACGVGAVGISVQRRARIKLRSGLGCLPAGACVRVANHFEKDKLKTKNSQESNNREQVFVQY